MGKGAWVCWWDMGMGFGLGVMCYLWLYYIARQKLRRACLQLLLHQGFTTNVGMNLAGILLASQTFAHGVFGGRDNREAVRLQGLSRSYVTCSTRYGFLPGFLVLLWGSGHPCSYIRI